MKPDESRDSETDSRNPQAPSSESIFEAEAVESIDNDPKDAQDSSPESAPGEVASPEIVDAALVPASTSLADMFDSSKNDSSMGQPGEHIWKEEPNRPAEHSQAKIPLSKTSKNCRIAFAIAALASLLFLVFYLAEEMRIKQNGLVLVRYSLLIGFVLLGAIAGLFRTPRDHGSPEARYAAYAGLVIAALGWFVFPSRWSVACLVWTLFQLPPVIANAFSPAKIDDGTMKFDVNDSIAANGGSVASLTLGFWSIIGSLFTSLSVINGILGLVLGIWGLNSRKKGMAVLGIMLCLLGVLACTLNVTYLFWEVIQAEEAELIQQDALNEF